MPETITSTMPPAHLPDWVPQPARTYLAHIKAGIPIRRLARQSGQHASTVLRQIRRFESRRDDPLVDAGLRRLGDCVPGVPAGAAQMKETAMTVQVEQSDPAQPLSEERLRSEARRVLRRLCETGAVLAVATEMDKAAVIREGPSGTSHRTAVVDREIAEAMALKNWIHCAKPGRICRYGITQSGRSALNLMLAAEENQALGLEEAPAAFAGRPGGADQQGAGNGRGGRVRYGMAESPLGALARRKDRDGTPFLSEDLVRAGERLREDFELAQLGPRLGQNWDRFLTGGVHRPAAPGGPAGGGAAAARARVTGALRDLGPGLGDVVLRCCCYLEGLESAERRLGWSARSGKIVLRIALQRLKRHYDGLGEAGSMMG